MQFGNFHWAANCFDDDDERDECHTPIFSFFFGENATLSSSTTFHNEIKESIYIHTHTCRNYDVGGTNYITLPLQPPCHFHREGAVG